MSVRKGIFYVFIANAINLIFSLFTSLFLPKFLSIDTYSYIKLFQLYITYVGILHLGYSDGMYLRLGGKKKKELDNKEIIKEFNTFKVFQLIIVIILSGISLIIKNEMLLLCSLAVLPINIGNYVRNLYQATGEFKKYSRYTNISTLLIFIVNIYLLFIIKTDHALYYIIGYIISYLIYSLFIEWEVYKEFGSNKNLSIKYFIENIKSGFLLMIGSFCNVIFTGIDRLFVQFLLGNIKFAYYSFAVSIENLLSVFITPISTVLYNYFCTNNNNENIKRIKGYLLTLSSYLIASAFVIKYIIYNFIDKYMAASDILFILFAATYLSIIVRCIHINLYKSNKKQNKYFKSMILIIILSIITNIVGYTINKSNYSIAIATLIVNGIWFVLGELEFKENRMNIKSYLYIVLTILLFFICNYINSIIIAFFVYIILITIVTILFMKDSINYLKLNIKQIIRKVRV